MRQFLAFNRSKCEDDSDLGVLIGHFADVSDAMDAAAFSTEWRGNHAGAVLDTGQSRPRLRRVAMASGWADWETLPEGDPAPEDDES